MGKRVVRFCKPRGLGTRQEHSIVVALRLEKQQQQELSHEGVFTSRHCLPC